MNKKILFLAPYPLNKAPSQRLKYEQYYGHFEKAGYQITTKSFVSDTFWKIIYKRGHILGKIIHTLFGYAKRIATLLTIPKYDIVYVHLWVTPLGPPCFEWLVKILSKKLVYDIDDLIYLGKTSKSNSLVKWVKGKAKPIFLMKHADHVIVCTPKLEEVCKQYNLNVTDISSTIDTYKYQPANNYNNNDNRITLGWSGSHSTSKYLYLLRNVFKQFQKSINFKLLVIGDPDFYIEGIEMEARPWDEKTEVEQLQKIDIGLYPLPDEEWVYGKSGLKALQYMALGIPTIATAIGANFRIIEDGKSGFLVNTDEQWLSRLTQLVSNPDLRKNIGLNARERVVNNYSVEATASVYLKILKDV